MSTFNKIKTVEATYEKIYHELFASVSQFEEKTGEELRNTLLCMTDLKTFKEQTLEVLTVLRHCVKMKVYKYQVAFIMDLYDNPEQLQSMLFDVPQTEECINKRYKDLSLRFHPDKT